MSIQDDFFDLSAELKGEQKKAFLRIWNWAIDMEEELERSGPIVANMKQAIRLMFFENKETNDAN